MQPRQIVAVLIGFIVILSAALFVISWTGDDGDDDTVTPDPTTTVTSSTTSTTTTSTTTTTIPTACTADTDTDTATSTTSTSTTGAEPPTTDEESDPDDDPGEPSVPTLGTNSSISTVGLDTVHFGLTVFQAEKAAGTTMIPCSPVSECYRITPVDAPKGISFVVQEGTIERVDITDGPITTRSGIGIGTAESRIVELFGDQIQREVINDDTVELVFVPSDETDANFRVIFTIRNEVVASFRSGRIPLVLSQSACTTG